MVLPEKLLMLLFPFSQRQCIFLFQGVGEERVADARAK